MPIAYLACSLVGEHLLRAGHEFSEKKIERPLRSSPRAIVNLDGNAEPERRERHAMDSFCPALEKRGTAELVHNDGVEAAFTRNEMRRSPRTEPSRSATPTSRKGGTCRSRTARVARLPQSAMDASALRVARRATLPLRVLMARSIALIRAGRRTHPPRGRGTSWERFLAASADDSATPRCPI